VTAIIEVRRVVCPTDLSDIAPRALATAHHVVRGAKCPVLVVHTD
jgi:hypothetical protein